MSEQEPDPGTQPTPRPQGPESDPEPGAANTEVFASAEFATAPGNAAAPGGPAEPEAAEGREATEGSDASTSHGAQSVTAAGYGAQYQFAAEQPPARRKRRRTGLVLGLGIGYAVLAAGTAFGVIAGNSPAPVDVTAVNASAYAAAAGTASASGTAKPKSSASPRTAPTTAAPTTAPPTTATPTSTVTGSVSDGVHEGDLRFFLLPPPQGPSSVQGDPDGTTESIEDVSQDFYNGSSTVVTYLQQGGFKAACTRTYQDSTIGANVTIELIQFDSSSDASQWMSGFSDDAGDTKQISVPGESSAEGWSYSSDGNYSLLGVYREGDTFFEVQVFGTQSIPASDLGNLISAEHSRLANG